MARWARVCFDFPTDSHTVAFVRDEMMHWDQTTTRSHPQRRLSVIG